MSSFDKRTRITIKTTASNLGLEAEFDEIFPSPPVIFAVGSLIGVQFPNGNVLYINQSLIVTMTVKNDVP